VSDPSTPLWLAHHPADQYERCVTIGDRHVCRRCLVLYPISLAVMVACLALIPDGAPPWVLAVLPLPAVVEWWAEHLGRAEYRPARQVAVTIPLAIALGAGLARYLDDPGDLAFWAMVIVYGGACAAIALWRWLDERAV
jgi:hypothetical protein